MCASPPPSSPAAERLHLRAGGADRDREGQKQRLRLGAAVTAPDSIEAPVRWAKKNATDGIYSGSWNADVLGDLATCKRSAARSSTRHSRQNCGERVAVAEKALAATKQSLAALPAQQPIYCGTVHTGGGAFRGTGPLGKPREDLRAARVVMCSRSAPRIASARCRSSQAPCGILVAHRSCRRRAARHWRNGLSTSATRSPGVR